MIRYLKHNEIDFSEWDKCISSSPHGLVYAFSWYLEKISPGWEALVEDNYTAVFPLTCRKKFGINYLFQPFFTQQLGLFSREEFISENKLRDFLSAIPKKFRLIEIQLNHSNLLNNSKAFEISERLTHHLDLSGSYENISRNYSENLSRNLKKANQSGIEISKNISPEDIVMLFRKNKGAEISNLKSSDYDTFLSLVNAFDEKKLLNSIGIYNSSKSLIAGATFVKSCNSYIFLFSATGEEARETGAMSMIIDSFIREHCNENNYLDFEGSIDKNLARFYKSFGSKEVVYLQLRKNSLPFFIRWLK